MPSRRPVRAAVLVGVVLLSTLPVSAHAHQTAPTLTPRIDGFSPEVEGLEATVRASQDATLLALAPAEGTVVEVLDDEGRAWARVTSTVVEADVTSPAFHAGTNPDGAVPDPLPAAEDPWVVVGREGRFQWFEHRLHPAGLEVPADVLASDTARDVATWAVPLRVDDVDVVLEGRLRHVPVTGRVEARLRTPRELAPGVVVEVASGPVPAFFLSNDGGATVRVLSGDGAPYVVLDGEGAAVNVASATWVEQRRLEGAPGAVEEVPDQAEFRRVSATPSHSWLETRAALPGVLPDDEVRASGRESVLSTWSIPVEIGGQLQSIEGETVWVPLTDRSVEGPVEGLVLRAVQSERMVATVVALALLGVWWWRRRADRSSSAG